MSAETLRRAARQIREDYMPGVEHHVADLLDRLADRGSPEFYALDHPALTVANDYLARAYLAEVDEDPYDKVVFIQGHRHSEPICAWPDCRTYLTREQMAEISEAPGGDA